MRKKNIFNVTVRTVSKRGREQENDFRDEQGDGDEEGEAEVGGRKRRERESRQINESRQHATVYFPFHPETILLTRAEEGERRRRRR